MGRLRNLSILGILTAAFLILPGAEASHRVPPSCTMTSTLNVSGNDTYCGFDVPQGFIVEFGAEVIAGVPGSTARIEIREIMGGELGDPIASCTAVAQTPLQSSCSGWVATLAPAVVCILDAQTVQQGVIEASGSCDKRAAS